MMLLLSCSARKPIRLARQSSTSSLKDNSVGSPVVGGDGSALTGDGDVDDDGVIVDAGSTYDASYSHDTTSTNSWPWCTVNWDGATVVADLFTSPLSRAGTVMR